MERIAPKDVNTIIRSIAGIIAAILFATEVVLLSTPAVLSDDLGERTATFAAMAVILLIALPRMYRVLEPRAVGARLKRATIQLVVGLAFLLGALALDAQDPGQGRTMTIAGFIAFVAALDLCTGVALGRRGFLEPTEDDAA